MWHNSQYLRFFFPFAVQHIIATSFSTRCLVWDLRKNEPIIKLSDSTSKVSYNDSLTLSVGLVNVSFNPDTMERRKMESRKRHAVMPRIGRRSVSCDPNVGPEIGYFSHKNIRRTSKVLIFLYFEYLYQNYSSLRFFTCTEESYH